MIKRIFFDNDECLSHSMYKDPEQECVIISFNDGDFYYTVIRPSATKVLEFSRDLVGVDNVYMLTSAIREHAEQVNEKGGFGFTNDHILAREDMIKSQFFGAYGAIHCYSNPDVADENNVLIDNLPNHYNTQKMQYIGINHTRYLNVADYYGVNNHEKEFFDDVTKFLLQKHGNP